MYTELENWLWFTLAFGPANPRKWNVLGYYGSVEKCREALSGGDLSKVLPNDARLVKAATEKRVNQLIEQCEKSGISVCTYDSEEYPERLREIYNPPSVLFYTGDIGSLNRGAVISSVGTRNPSEYSVRTGERLITDLVKGGFMIASGFAVGLDSLSLRSALLAGGRAFAVLPCGHLYDYPPENASAKEIVSKRGAVITEYFPTDKPNSLSFRARNRILAGLSLGTLVLQAGSKSGALSTASFALSQGRDIFCVPPHDIYDDSYAGAAELLRVGAEPVFDASDVINSYSRSYPHILTVRSDAPAAPEREPKKQVSRKKPAKKSPERLPEPGALIPVPLVPPEALGGVKKQIYDLIREKGEAHFDELSVGIGDVFELEAYLTELELDGLVASLPGNRFSAT